MFYNDLLNAPHKIELNQMETKYYCKKHGLLFIVYTDYDEGFGVVSIEDSRWEDEEKAKEHCRLLNAI